MKRWGLAAAALPSLALAQPVHGGGDTATMQQVQVVGSYRVSGDRRIRPSALWDDGRKTFLDWPDHIEAPAIFTIDAAGSESLVNCYHRDGRYVIDAVHPHLLFRLDRLTARADRRAAIQ